MFITSDAQLLKFGAGSVRPQGRAAAGMAGIRLAPGASVIWFGAVDRPWRAAVQDPAGRRGHRGRQRWCAAGHDGRQRQGHPATPSIPPKGRATGGVRCHRFLKGEDVLVLAWAGPGPARAATAAGTPVRLPAAGGSPGRFRRAGAQPLAAVGGGAGRAARNERCQVAARWSGAAPACACLARNPARGAAPVQQGLARSGAVSRRAAHGFQRCAGATRRLGSAGRGARGAASAGCHTRDDGPALRGPGSTTPPRNTRPRRSGRDLVGVGSAETPPGNMPRRAGTRTLHVTAAPGRPAMQAATRPGPAGIVPRASP